MLTLLTYLIYKITYKMKYVNWEFNYMETKTVTDLLFVLSEAYTKQVQLLNCMNILKDVQNVWDVTGYSSNSNLV